jgi:hypothetical protein
MIHATPPTASRDHLLFPYFQWGFLNTNVGSALWFRLQPTRLKIGPRDVFRPSRLAACWQKA